MSRNRPTRSFRPTLDVLEDRCLPAVAIDPPIFVLPPFPYGPVASSPAPVAPTTFGSATALTQYLISDALIRYQDLFGQPAWWWDFPYGRGIDTIMPMAATDAATASAFSSTNVQVAGVDEADLVKTDGQYIYMVSGSQLVILQAQPADGLQVVSRTMLEGAPSALYLDGDRVTVLSSLWPPFGGGGGSAAMRGPEAMTKVTVLDVADRTAPRTVQETYAEGALQSSRAVGDRVYVVLDNGAAILPAPLLLNVNNQWVYETQDQYLARIAGHEIDLALPHLYTRPGGPGSGLQAAGLLSDLTHLYQPQSANDTTLISVLAFDVTSDSSGPAGSTSAYANYGSTIYATADHLYVVSQRRNWWAGQASSVIDQFTLDGDSIDLTATGVVPGWVLNQYSLDESGGYLRVATTTGWGWGSWASNGVYVLAPQDGVLTVVGSVEGLAPGEQIRSAYFEGDRAYLVTSHVCDPLFILDLSDPTAPHVAGELRLPGYSTYLQPLDATHLLGVGRDGDDSLKLALFDVTDPTAPRLVDVYDIAAPPGSWPWWTSSEAEYNPHALSYFPETHTLALPVYGGWPYLRPVPLDDLSVEVSPAAPPGLFFQPSMSSLEVFQVDPASGFHLLGRIDQDSQVRRSLRIGDTIYSVADDSVKALPLDDPTGPGATEARLDGDLETLHATLQNADVGTAFDGEVLEFTGSPAADLVATIDWGDGQTSAGDVVALSDGRYAIHGTHTYAAPGQFEYTVTFARTDRPPLGPMFSAWVDVVVPPPPNDGGQGAAPAPATAAAPGDGGQQGTTVPADAASTEAQLAQALTAADAPSPAPPGSPTPAATNSAPTPGASESAAVNAPAQTTSPSGNVAALGPSASPAQSPDGLDLGALSDVAPVPTILDEVRF
jgi:hypothetical protein